MAATHDASRGASLGAIRGLSRREELAAFAVARGNCLFDNFRFHETVEAYYLAQRLAPHKRGLHDSWGLGIYSSKIWAEIMSLPDSQKDMPYEVAIRRAAAKLDGPNVNQFRGPAADSLLRIIRNRRRRDENTRRKTALSEYLNQESN